MLVCNSCGKTGILAGTSICPVCGSRSLSIASTLASSVATLSATPSARGFLVDATGRKFWLLPSSASVIGTRGCAILISDPGLPPQAAKITPNGGGYYLEDLGGRPCLNGSLLSGPTGLMPGDRIQLNASIFVYNGPAAPSRAYAASVGKSLAVTPTTAASAPSSSSHALPPVPFVPPPTPAALIPSPPSSMGLPGPSGTIMPPGGVLRSWTPIPIIEGLVENVDGPHRVEKGSMAAKLLGAAVLGVLSKGYLTMLPFMGQREMNVWYLRVRDRISSQLFSVLMAGEPTSIPHMSDFLAIWGTEKEGNIIMEHGYNYNTNAELRLKK